MFAIFQIWLFVIIGRPQDLIAELIPYRPALVLTALMLLLIIFRYGGRLNASLLLAGEGKKYLLFYAVMLIGIPFAYHRRVAFDFIVFSYANNILFYFICVVMVDSLDRLKRVLLILTACALFYAFFTLTQGTMSAGRFFTYGAMFDPNDIAYVLVSLFPLSFFYLLNGEGFFKKIIALCNVAASTAVILLTASRGGLLSLSAASVAVFATGASIKKSYKAIFLATISIAAAVMLASGGLNVERYKTITSIGSDYNVTDEFGRFQIWERGLTLLIQNPFTGVGAYCFPNAIGYLRADIGAIPKWQAPHNSYVEVAVETGVAGISLFLALTASSMRTFFTCSRARSCDGQLRTIAALLIVAFVGHLTAAFFLTQAYSTLFTLFFAFSTILGGLSAPHKAVAARPAGN
ncbi:MAG: O-antigen ligase family protein [Deltaproteobacteria bacterium]|nr:O-antigen ligase family protein [Deltaproteobacteria bacterium]